MALSREECRTRLVRIFPRSSFDVVASSPLAAAAVVALLYADAIAPDTGHAPADQMYLRPTGILFMSNEAAARTGEVDRVAWQRAVNLSSSKKALAELHRTWGVDYVPWYGDNTRETLRDETFRIWQQCGAIRQRPGLSVTSGAPRWALTGEFASLFDPTLSGVELVTAIQAWQASHLDANALLRVHTAHVRETQAGEVPVTLPDGTTRALEPGLASLIAVGVIEEWALARLHDPVVLAISQPGDKLYAADAKLLKALKLSLDVTKLLPDLILADIRPSGPAHFWLVEVVATDGPVTEPRKAALTKWATEHGIQSGTVHFLSAFESRGSAAARRRLKDLAEGTFAWFLDEPTRELSWAEIGS